MHRFTIHYSSGEVSEVHFDAGEGSTWRKLLDNFKKGTLEVLYCNKIKDYIRINWDNVLYIAPIAKTKTIKVKK